MSLTTAAAAAHGRRATEHVRIFGKRDNDQSRAMIVVNAVSTLVSFFGTKSIFMNVCHTSCPHRRAWRRRYPAFIHAAVAARVLLVYRGALLRLLLKGVAEK